MQRNHLRSVREDSSLLCSSSVSRVGGRDLGSAEIVHIMLCPTARNARRYASCCVLLNQVTIASTQTILIREEIIKVT